MRKRLAKTIKVYLIGNGVREKGCNLYAEAKELHQIKGRRLGMGETTSLGTLFV